MGGLRRWKWVGLVVALLLATDVKGNAGGGSYPECGPASPQDTLFVGKVLEVKEPDVSTRVEEVRFAVEESLQGRQRAGEVITVRSFQEYCGYGFVVGKHYLVDAGKYPAPSTSICSSAMELNTGGRIPALTGQVLLAKSLDATSTGSDPMPRIPVTVKDVRTGEKHRTITDSDGIYTFLSLTPGTYTVSVKLPPKRALPDALEPVKVQASSGGWAMCKRDVSVVPTGRVVGRVVDPGGLRPSDARIVTLYWVTGQGVRKEVDSDVIHSDGKFEFSDLWDGRYILQYTLCDPPQHLTRCLLYPGVELEKDASAIEVKNGGTAKRVVFRLPKGFGLDAQSCS